MDWISGWGGASGALVVVGVAAVALLWSINENLGKIAAHLAVIREDARLLQGKATGVEMYTRDTARALGLLAGHSDRV